MPFIFKGRIFSQTFYNTLIFFEIGPTTRGAINFNVL